MKYLLILVFFCDDTFNTLVYEKYPSYKQCTAQYKRIDKLIKNEMPAQCIVRFRCIAENDTDYLARS